MAFRLAAISLRQIPRLLLLRCRGASRAEGLELLVLRQELAELHRQVTRMITMQRRFHLVRR